MPAKILVNRAVILCGFYFYLSLALVGRRYSIVVKCLDLEVNQI